MSLGVDVVLAGLAASALANGIFDLIKSFLRRRRESERESSVEEITIRIRKASGQLNEINFRPKDERSIAEVLEVFEGVGDVERIEAD